MACDAGSDDETFEKTMEVDKVVPFPHEKNFRFMKEAIHVFEPDVIVTNSLATGEILKSVMLMHKYAVGIAPTLKAQRFCNANLKAWVASQNMAPGLLGPADKPKDLIEYEETLRQDPPKAPAQAPSVPEPKAPLSEAPKAPPEEPKATIAKAPMPKVAAFGSGVL